MRATTLAAAAIVAQLLLVTLTVANPRQPTRLVGEVFKIAMQENGNHTVELKATYAHPTLITRGTSAHARGEAAFGEENDDEPLSIYQYERPRLEPSLVFTVENGAVTKLRLNFGSEAFAIPEAEFTLKPRHSETPLLQHSTVYDAVAKWQDIPIPDSFSLDSFEPEMLVDVALRHQEVTTFAYSLESGIPSNVYSSHDTYDLVPHNSSMLTKFMIKFTRDENKDSMSLWVSRKALMPDFTLIIAVDGEVLAHANIQHDPTSTDALGFDVDVTENVPRLLKERVDVVVHFYEFTRRRVATVAVPNLRETINELIAADSPTSSKTLETNLPRCYVRLQYHRATKFVGLHFLQGEPMAKVMVSLYSEGAAAVAGEEGEGGRRQLFLRETDAVVPFTDHADDIQYGWDDALPSIPSAVTTDDGVDIFTRPIEIELSYDPAPKRSLGDGLVEWLQVQGGKIANVSLEYLERFNNSFIERHPLLAAAAIAEQSRFAAIPYSALVTSSSIDRSHWSKLMKNHSSKHDAHTDENSVHADAGKILRLAAAVHMHLFDESMNYRPYFRTFAKSANKLPPFWSADELALFSFEPQIAVEAKRMRDLWEVEYEVLQDMKDMLPRPFSRSTYFTVRSQIETRLLNLSSELVLAPFVDLLTHDDDPNTKIEYNDENHQIYLYAGKPIPAGTPLTIDFGVGAKTGIDFLIQFGFVPQGAIKAAALNISGVPMYLTEKEDSYNAIVRAVREGKLGGANDDDDDDAAATATVQKIIEDRLKELVSTPHPTHPKSELALAAETLLTAERKVLSKYAKR